jgi:hypothetical protein
MALTVAAVANVKDTVWGNKRIKTRQVTFDSTYPTGGESLVASDFGLKTIDTVLVAGPARKSDGSNAVIASFDHTNKTLMAFWSAASGAAPGQVSNNTDLSTYSVRVVAIGN